MRNGTEEMRNGNEIKLGKAHHLHAWPPTCMATYMHGHLCAWPENVTQYASMTNCSKEDSHYSVC